MSRVCNISRTMAVVLVAALVGLGSATASETPHEVVERATEALLSRLGEVRPLYETDERAFFAAVEEVLDPFIDFDGFARGVMAKHYRKATPAQRQTFRDLFKIDLIRTYAKALIEYDNEKIVVLPPRRAKKGRSGPEGRGRARVQVEIHARNGRVYPVAYTMALVDGRWLLKNVVVDGINLGVTFRNRFASEASKYRGDIDKVIANWDVDVRDG